MGTMSGTRKYLFGETDSWLAEHWVASDDRVRGGRSISHLDYASEASARVRFHGELDIKALGGAGFASQRSPEQCSWDLSQFEGLNLAIHDGDGKKYTLVIKDTVAAERPDGRLYSTVSWEYDFEGKTGEVCVPWEDLKPTYRGKPAPDAAPLDRGNIKSISFMMRSFFGEQEGPFNLELIHVAATSF
ncbi:NADH:ubiquinone oxidoreductase intermediate-associated protein 30 [Xylaria venustula]|nr:NADH:ubiquinone oxidoreductase intermediate-associated protein 30 [Xylaria venustula]